MNVKLAVISKRGGPGWYRSMRVYEDGKSPYLNCKNTGVLYESSDFHEDSKIGREGAKSKCLAYIHNHNLNLVEYNACNGQE